MSDKVQYGWGEPDEEPVAEAAAKATKNALTEAAVQFYEPSEDLWDDVDYECIGKWLSSVEKGEGPPEPREAPADLWANEEDDYLRKRPPSPGWMNRHAPIAEGMRRPFDEERMPGANEWETRSDNALKSYETVRAEKQVAKMIRRSKKEGAGAKANEGEFYGDIKRTPAGMGGWNADSKKMSIPAELAWGSPSQPPPPSKPAPLPALRRAAESSLASSSTGRARPTAGPSSAPKPTSTAPLPKADADAFWRDRQAKTRHEESGRSRHPSGALKWFDAGPTKRAPHDFKPVLEHLARQSFVPQERGTGWGEAATQTAESQAGGGAWPTAASASIQTSTALAASGWPTTPTAPQSSANENAWTSIAKSQPTTSATTPTVASSSAPVPPQPAAQAPAPARPDNWFGGRPWKSSRPVESSATDALQDSYRRAQLPSRSDGSEFPWPRPAEGKDVLGGFPARHRIVTSEWQTPTPRSKSPSLDGKGRIRRYHAATQTYSSKPVPLGERVVPPQHENAGRWAVLDGEEGWFVPKSRAVVA